MASAGARAYNGGPGGRAPGGGSEGQSPPEADGFLRLDVHRSPVIHMC